MTREEKTQIFDFLTTAEAFITGIRPDISMPNFPDDGATVTMIAETIHECTKCRLCETRTKVVPGEGPEDLSRVSVMVIGEGPGADEDTSGRPFVGKAGQLLDKMLAAIQLSRTENCYIANIVKCRPPQNREPSPDEVEACIPYLHEQIERIHPRMILALGRTATQSLLKTSDGINKLRGKFFDYRGIPLLPTYHPSALLRDENLKRPAWEDLKVFKAEMNRIVQDAENC